MDASIDVRRQAWTAAAVVGGMGLFIGLETIDEPDILPVHVLLELFEILLIALTSVMVVLLFQVNRRWRDDQAKLACALEVARLRGEGWRADAREHLTGLGQAIEEQFSRWNLTGHEREVARLLLKGLSYKQVALVTASSERIVHEAARSIYAKAGLGGRGALLAFFMDGLTAPIESSEAFTVRRGVFPRRSRGLLHDQPKPRDPPMPLKAV
jgi:DNA-binding CsgD family transcriptional regulator